MYLWPYPRCYQDVVYLAHFPIDFGAYAPGSVVFLPFVTELCCFAIVKVAYNIVPEFSEVFDSSAIFWCSNSIWRSHDLHYPVLQVDSVGSLIACQYSTGSETNAAILGEHNEAVEKVFLINIYAKR